MKATYRLYIDGTPQPDYASFTASGLAKANETNAEHWPGYEWRREDRPAATPFTVRCLDGTVRSYRSHADYEQSLSRGGMNDYRRWCSARIRQEREYSDQGSVRRNAA